MHFLLGGMQFGPPVLQEMVEHRFEGDLRSPACLLTEAVRVSNHGRGFDRTKPLGVCLDVNLDASTRTKSIQQRPDAATVA